MLTRDHKPFHAVVMVLSERGRQFLGIGVG